MYLFPYIQKYVHTFHKPCIIGSPRMRRPWRWFCSMWRTPWSWNRRPGGSPVMDEWTLQKYIVQGTWWTHPCAEEPCVVHPPFLFLGKFPMTCINDRLLTASGWLMKYLTFRLKYPSQNCFNCFKGTIYRNPTHGFPVQKPISFNQKLWLFFD